MVIMTAKNNTVSSGYERIGINEIVLQVPNLSTTAADIVRAFHTRNKNISENEREQLIANDIGKMTNGLGIKTVRIPGYSESNITFVANTIYEFCKKVLSNSEDMAKLEAEPIRSIYYGSESNSDRSRPEVESSLLLVYSKLLEEDQIKHRKIVEMLKRSALVPITYACAGGGIGLVDAVAKVKFSIDAGMSQSSLVITADTSIYDHRRAPNAEFTQGAGAVLLWITSNPRIASIMYEKDNGNYHMPLSDFTKFGADTPLVHGKFSERVFVYTVAKALETLERYGNGISLKEIEFFVTHVPFPKQSIYFASFLFAHQLKTYQKGLFDEIQKRGDVGAEPLPNGGRITDLMDSKFAAFNNGNGNPMSEEDIIGYIEKDAEIEAYWNWLKNLRNQKEFDLFIERTHIKSALIYPSEIGNSYSSSAFVAFTSLLKNTPELFDGKPRMGVLAFYGSGALAKSIVVEVCATSEILSRNISVTLHDTKHIGSEQYEQLHSNLLEGDAARTIGKGDLIEKDKEFLSLEVLPRGFHIKHRNPNGTGEYCYSDGSKMTPLRIRY
jgi:3-hydroxy-3-methylglutaryl CoA synthase